jgi:hypothetical protein
VAKLRLVRSVRTTVRLIASILAAVVTVYVVAVALSFTELTRAGWLFYRYLDVFGLAPRVAHLFDWPGYSENDGVLRSIRRLHRISRVARILDHSIWSFIFSLCVPQTRGDLTSRCSRRLAGV